MAKSRTSYFDMNIQRKGVDFLDQKPVEEIQKDAKKRIFRDMAFGNIDYEKYGRYFMEPRFLEQLITVSSYETEDHRLKFTALREYDLKHPGDQRVVSACALEGRLTNAMSTINLYMNTVKSSGYNIACLPDLVTQLYQYRQDIANNY